MWLARGWATAQEGSGKEMRPQLCLYSGELGLQRPVCQRRNPGFWADLDTWAVAEAPGRAIQLKGSRRVVQTRHKCTKEYSQKAHILIKLLVFYLVYYNHQKTHNHDIEREKKSVTCVTPAIRDSLGELTLSCV